MSGIIVDYNPLTDPAPGAVGIRKGRTAAEEARKLRGMWIAGGVFPTTFEQHVRMRPSLTYQMDFSRSGKKASGSVGAFEAVWWTAASAGCSMEAAREAVETVMPELYADHWEEGWQHLSENLGDAERASAT